MDKAKLDRLGLSDVGFQYSDRRMKAILYSGQEIVSPPLPTQAACIAWLDAEIGAHHIKAYVSVSG